jgi:hypothetical protein
VEIAHKSQFIISMFPRSQSNRIDEQIVYDRLLHCVRTESPPAVLGHFCRLFVDGVGYEDRLVWNTIEQVVDSARAEAIYLPMLNRCCYILINHWQVNERHSCYIRELIDLIEGIDRGISIYAKTARKLRNLLLVYRTSEDFQRIKMLARTSDVLGDRAELKNKPLITYFNRYPFIYEHSLVNDESCIEHKSAVKTVKEQVQQNFELSFSQYITYQIRQIHGKEDASDRARLQPAKNPTLMSDKELGYACREYLGKHTNGLTYSDSSSKFKNSFSGHQKFSKFKQEFYEYLIADIDKSYVKSGFGDRLYRKIGNILPEYDNRWLDELLTLRACSKTLDYLTLESKQNPLHLTYVDLITNMGPIVTTGLFLKMALFCRKSKTMLENRLALLFGHYQDCTRDRAPWLVKSLEHWNVANTLHFGSVDTSLLRKSIVG